MIEIGLFSIATAILFVGFKIQKFIEIYAIISDRYVSSNRKERYSKLNVLFVTDDEKVFLLIGKDKYKLDAYEEYIVRENLLNSVAANEVKVNLKNDDVLSLIHSKLCIKDINNNIL